MIVHAPSCLEFAALKNTGKKFRPYFDVEYHNKAEGDFEEHVFLKTITYETIERIQHYPVVKEWRRKIKPHLNNPELQAILAADFNKYTVGRWGTRFRPGQLPGDFETCDWELAIRGRHPEYFKYVKHGACHWLVNFNHHLAKLVEPNRTWRIITSNEHSTVWDNNLTLFDMNGLALYGSAVECFEAAAFGPNSTVLPPDEGVDAGLPRVHYAREIIGLRVKPLYDVPAPTPDPMRSCRARKRAKEDILSRLLAENPPMLTPDGWVYPDAAPVNQAECGRIGIPDGQR